MRFVDPRAPEAAYAAVLDALPIVAYAASPDGAITYISPAWERYTGHDAEAVIDRGYETIIDPAHLDRALRVWGEAMQAGTTYRDEFRIRLGDGTFRWVLSQAEPMRDAGGAIVAWFGTVTDIEDRVQADQTREMYVSLAENSNDFIGIADLDGNGLFVNEAGRKLLEIGSLEKARETQLFDYFMEEDLEFVRSVILPAMERDGHWAGDFRFRNFRTGAAVPVLYNAFLLVDASGKTIGMATISRDLRERKRLEEGLRLLSRTGAAASGSLDYHSTLRKIAQALIEGFASYCAIDVRDDGHRWERIVYHRDKQLRSAVENVPEPQEDHPVAQALTKGESSVVTVDETWTRSFARTRERVDAISALRPRSFITVPVRRPDGAVVGALTCALDDRDTREDYSPADLPFVEEVGRRAGAAIANARLFERERRIAVELQAASLPTALPQVDHLKLDAEYRPGSDEATIGGDWYDAFVLEDGRVVLTVGDVLGHGLHAAVTMTKLRQAMQSAAMVDANPSVMLNVADRTMRLLDPESFATALAAIYDVRTHSLIVASAGHPGPAIRRENGEVEEIINPGPMLGLGDGSPYPIETVAAPPGTMLVFFTDGLVEARRNLDAGHARLHDAMRTDAIVRSEHPAREIVEYVLGGEPGSDDIAVLTVTCGRS